MFFEYIFKIKILFKRCQSHLKYILLRKINKIFKKDFFFYSKDYKYLYFFLLFNDQIQILIVK